MTFVAMIGPALTTVGTLLVVLGLYRRDPAAQRRLRRGWGWVSTRLLRRKPRVASGAGRISALGSLEGEGMTPPLKAKPDAPTGERVARLEENIEILSGTIQSQATARKDGDRKLRQRIDALAELLQGEVAEAHRLAEEARAPERMEWWGLALLLLGAGWSLTWVLVTA